MTNLLTQKKYREQIKLASAAFKDQKETPVERALWWIDWVMRNPDSNHLKSSAQNLNFLELESFDVVAFLTVAAFLSVYVSVWFFKSFLNCVFGDRKSVPGKRKKE